MRVLSLVVVLFLTLPGFLERAADVRGGKDPPFLKRYEGSDIILYRTKTYDQYHLITKNDQGQLHPLQKWDLLEGAIARIIYRVPEGHSPLELLRNYQQALKEAGFTQSMEVSPCTSFDGQVVRDFYYQGAGKTEDYPFYPDQVCYLRAQGARALRRGQQALFVPAPGWPGGRYEGRSNSRRRRCGRLEAGRNQDDQGDGCG